MKIYPGAAKSLPPCNRVPNCPSGTNKLILFVYDNFEPYLQLHLEDLLQCDDMHHFHNISG